VPAVTAVAEAPPCTARGEDGRAVPRGVTWAGRPVILGAARTPIGRFLGGFSELGAAELGGAAIRAAVERAGIGADDLDEVLMGNVVSAGLGQAPARQAAHQGGVPFSVPAFTVSDVCGSGLRAVMLAAQAVAAGQARVLVAGGMESMSHAPYLLERARTGYRLGDSQLVDAMIRDGLWCSFEDQHMGMAAEWIAREYDLRREELDEYALASHRRAVAAQSAGWLADEITGVAVGNRASVRILDADELPRSDASLERLAGLRPSFTADGVITAGNASALADGAAAVVVADEAWARERGLVPLARLTGWASAATDPLKVFTCPPLVVRRLAELTGCDPASFDLVEINEAFSSQVVANIAELGLDPERVNVTGGSIAFGHPLGASGARILVTLLHALLRRGAERGLASLCLGGGGSVGVAVEALPGT
jgi:acetyl-CoA C-acetyltransferase